MAIEGADRALEDARKIGQDHRTDYALTIHLSPYLLRELCDSQRADR
jgi:hypothetical protein